MGIFGIFWEFLGGLLVRHVIPPWVCCAAVWNGSGEDVPWGMQGFFYGNGGERVAVVWRLCLTCLTCLTR